MSLGLCLATIFLAGSLLGFSLWYNAQPEKFTILFGNSMRPTLDTFDVIYDRPVGVIRRGDMPPFRAMRHRVVLMPGETFDVRHGKITVYEPGPPHALAEPYVVYDYDWDWPRTSLAADEYGILGDNRTDPYARIVFIAKRADLTRTLDRLVFPPWRRRTF